MYTILDTVATAGKQIPLNATAEQLLEYLLIYEWFTLAELAAGASWSAREPFKVARDNKL